jgi:hypothetical protein
VTVKLTSVLLITARFGNVNVIVGFLFFGGATVSDDDEHAAVARASRSTNCP